MIMVCDSDHRIKTENKAIRYSCEFKNFLIQRYLWEEDITCAALAREYDLNPKLLKTWLNNKGYDLKKKDYPTLKKKAIELYQQGMKLTAIANRIKVDKASVRRWLIKFANYQVNDRDKVIRLHTKVLELRSEGKSYGYISYMLGTTKQNAHKICEKYELVDGQRRKKLLTTQSGA